MLKKSTSVKLFRQFTLVVCLSSLSLFAAADAQDLTGIKCIINGGQNARQSAAAACRDGQVYFCCPKCAAAFTAAPEKYTTPANHQLVLTGQYTQAACPVSGGKASPDHSTSVGGTEVKFCCGKCLAKVEAVNTLAKRAEMVFGDAVFEKAWAKASAPPEPTPDGK